MATKIDHYRDGVYKIGRERSQIIGREEVMKDLFTNLNIAASHKGIVLITGETGTGKELCADSIHYNRPGGVKRTQFVRQNCAAIPRELLESELFGHEKGAFSYAHKSKVGMFEYAHNGTILLDEIGDMDMDLQAKVLRVIREKYVKRIGANKSTPTNAKIICSTNKDLEKEVENGNFRKDLFYRINVHNIEVPSLKERAEDVPLIANYFLEKYNSEFGKNVEGFSSDAEKLLREYQWNGNVGELENVLSRTLVFMDFGEITPEMLFFGSEMPKGKKLREILKFQKKKSKED